MGFPWFSIITIIFGVPLFSETSIYSWDKMKGAVEPPDKPGHQRSEASDLTIKWAVTKDPMDRNYTNKSHETRIPMTFVCFFWVIFLTDSVKSPFSPPIWGKILEYIFLGRFSQPHVLHVAQIDLCHTPDPGTLVPLPLRARMSWMVIPMPMSWIRRIGRQPLIWT